MRVSIDDTNANINGKLNTAGVKDMTYHAVSMSLHLAARISEAVNRWANFFSYILFVYVYSYTRFIHFILGKFHATIYHSDFALRGFESGMM